jgi:bifunctional DNA-binding transcriptional regulator/antitoxin component of YhaV-PrlF toxin-antitoxin module
MPTATTTSKGQITIPLEIRERYGIDAGVSCVFVPIDEHRFEVYPKTASIMDLYGSLKYDGPPMTVEDMDDAIAEYLAEKHGR